MRGVVFDTAGAGHPQDVVPQELLGGQDNPFAAGADTRAGGVPHRSEVVSCRRAVTTLRLTPSSRAAAGDGAGLAQGGFDLGAGDVGASARATGASGGAEVAAHRGGVDRPAGGDAPDGVPGGVGVAPRGHEFVVDAPAAALGGVVLVCTHPLASSDPPRPLPSVGRGDPARSQACTGEATSDAPEVCAQVWRHRFAHPTAALLDAATVARARALTAIPTVTYAMPKAQFTGETLRSRRIAEGDGAFQARAHSTQNSLPSGSRVVVG